MIQTTKPDKQVNLRNTSHLAQKMAATVAIEMLVTDDSLSEKDNKNNLNDE